MHSAIRSSPSAIIAAEEQRPNGSRVSFLRAQLNNHPAQIARKFPFRARTPLREVTEGVIDVFSSFSAKSRFSEAQWPPRR